MEVDASTSSDPGTLYRAFPQPVVRLTRLDHTDSSANNNNVTPVEKRRQMPTPNSTPKMPTKRAHLMSSPPASRNLVIEEDEEEDLCLVSRASAHLSKLMDQFNCLTKIHNDKNANFQVELSKHLQDLMVKIVNPSNVADPQNRLNFGRLALILQGSTTIYSKKVEYLGDLFSHFLIRLSSEIGKAAMGNTGDAEGEEDEAGDESQSQGQDGDRPQASRRKKQQSSQSSPFSLVNFKVKKKSRMGPIKKIQLRPKIFPVLFYNEQCEADKSRVVTLNPELSGETTCYRMWAPVNEDQGVLNPDCKDSVISKFSDCDMSVIEVDNDPPMVSEENLEDPEPPEAPMEVNFDFGEPESQDELLDILSKPTEQTEILGSKDNNAADVEPAAVNVETDDPWKTLAPGDTIEDLRLQPQPPIPKFKSRVVLEIDEAYFKNWYKEAKKTRGCFGDENVHEAILLEKEGKLLQHQDLKNKRKRIDIDSDRGSKKSIKSLDELFAHHDSDDEDVLGFSEEKAIYQSTPGFSNLPITAFEPVDWTLDPEIADEEDNSNLAMDLGILSDEESNENEGAFDLDVEIQIEDPLCIAARVDGFMKFMKLKFSEDEKKPKFSFKTYCESILGAFPPPEEEESEVKLDFKELLNDESEDQGVARQLLATLMLANHKNVEIEGSIEGTLANETLSLRLLNRTRHLPEFEEDEQFS